MEFLLDNPFMVLILLALFSVSSVFKKASENQKKSSNKPKEKKYSNPGKPFGELKEIFKEVTRTVQEEQHKSPEPTLTDIYQQRKFEYEKQRQQENHLTAAEPYRGKESNTKQIQGNNEELEINKSKLIDSVIWSEILGPPRSKKSYGNYRRY